MYDMLNAVALDFETYSDVDLRKHGLDNYTKGKHFKVLLAGLATVRQTQLIDFMNALDFDSAVADLRDHLAGRVIVAHNATFEREVLKALGIVIPTERFIDTAVLARAAGYAGSLENAARQAMRAHKHPEGDRLVKQYCVPRKELVESGAELVFDEYHRHPLTDWLEFGSYCVQDAELALLLAEDLFSQVAEAEVAYSQATMRMNEAGWPVDMTLVNYMNTQYKNNLQSQLADFRDATGAYDLNLNSTTQLIAWCAARGVTTKSFDEKSVARMLKQVTKRLDVTPGTDPKYIKLWEVSQLLLTKQALGGSSLKKLDVIQNTVGSDGRLRNQYMHLGASATYRTSGRGVQMQNLKRLHGEGDDVTELLGGEHWSNDKLASNLRQCFRAEQTNGALIVGDFSSVESRGLAWQAGEDWKLDAYLKGEDLYKVQAASMFGMPVSAIGKAERQIGKVAELSCGYGAGPGAVKDFAEKMGVTLSEAESTKLVRDWRDANPAIVEYWKSLDTMLHRALIDGAATFVTTNVKVIATRSLAPGSLTDQVGSQCYSLTIIMRHNGRKLLSRVLHGVYEDGNNLAYFKPSERKTGDAWVKDYIDPKTKRKRTYTIYGGKLAGILTQSLCREIFFQSLMGADQYFSHVTNVELIGQFHDELVLHWTPSERTSNTLSISQAERELEVLMTVTDLQGFPLGADIKSAFRYIK